MININEPLNFHINNFKNNNINLKQGQIRNLLYSIREEKYPKDDKFLEDISNIEVQLSNNIEEPKESFFIFKGEFINFKKNKKLEKNIIF